VDNAPGAIFAPEGGWRPAGWANVMKKGTGRGSIVVVPRKKEGAGTILVRRNSVENQEEKNQGKQGRPPGSNKRTPPLWPKVSLRKKKVPTPVPRKRDGIRCIKVRDDLPCRRVLHRRRGISDCGGSLGLREAMTGLEIGLQGASSSNRNHAAMT